MKKIICKVEYDTEASELVSKRTSGQFGDPAGYEESLYQTAGGKKAEYGKGKDQCGCLDRAGSHGHFGYRPFFQGNSQGSQRGGMECLLP